MKALIYIFLAVGTIIGSYLGSLLDNGNFLGVWGLILSSAFGIGGIYLGYKISQNY